MELTSIAQWLNSFFEGYDHAILLALHHMAEAAGGVLTPLFKILSLFGEKGIFFIGLSVIFMCFKKTRKVGICMFGAICCGAIITNLILKDLIARPRPFVDTDSIYCAWWKFVGAAADNDFSFPSGHMTATTAAMTSVFLFCRKKYSWTAFFGVVLMGMSRNYLMVHYPSDVLAGIIVGAAAAFIAYLITNLIFKICEKYKKTGFCHFVLNFDLFISTGLVKTSKH